MSKPTPLHPSPPFSPTPPIAEPHDPQTSFTTSETENEVPDNTSELWAGTNRSLSSSEQDIRAHTQSPSTSTSLFLSSPSFRTLLSQHRIAPLEEEDKVFIQILRHENDYTRDLRLRKLNAKAKEQNVIEEIARTVEILIDEYFPDVDYRKRDLPTGHLPIRNNTPDGWITRAQRGLVWGGRTIYVPGDPRYWGSMSKSEQDSWLERHIPLKREGNDINNESEGEQFMLPEPAISPTYISEGSPKTPEEMNGWSGMWASYELRSAIMRRDIEDAMEAGGLGRTISREDMERMIERGRKTKERMREGARLWHLKYGDELKETRRMLGTGEFAEAKWKGRDPNQEQVEVWRDGEWRARTEEDGERKFIHPYDGKHVRGVGYSYEYEKEGKGSENEIESDSGSQDLMFAFSESPSPTPANSHSQPSGLSRLFADESRSRKIQAQAQTQAQAQAQPQAKENTPTLTFRSQYPPSFPPPLPYSNPTLTPSTHSPSQITSQAQASLHPQTQTQTQTQHPVKPKPKPNINTKNQEEKTSRNNPIPVRRPGKPGATQELFTRRDLF